MFEVFDGDMDLCDFLQRAAGYSLTGDTREQCLFICWGGGANGKSTLLNILRSVCGEYGANTPFSTFEPGDSHTAATNDVAGLVGRRLVTAGETNEGRALNEARVKAITGKDPVTARFLHKEFFTYTPTYKVWLSVNHKPKVAGTDDGIWRRIRLIPFTVSFKGREDKTLDDTLRAELPGVLAWAVRGALNWQEQGLREPARVLEATQNYREESDTMAAFINDCCTVLPGAQASAAELLDAYNRWAKRSNEPSMTSKVFGAEMLRALRGMGAKEVDYRRSMRGMGFIGVGLRATEERAVQGGFGSGSM